MNRKKKWIALIASVVALALVACLILLTGSSEEIPEGMFQNVYTAEDEPMYSKEEITADTAVSLGTVGDLEIVYDPVKVGIQIVDVRNTFRWTSAFDSQAYPQEADESLARNLAALLQIVYADADDVTNIARSHDEGVTVFAEKLQNGVSLTFTFSDVSIAVTMELWLDELGLVARIPQEKLKEEGDYRLLTAELLPLFGAATNSEQGYMVYPDGSGAIYRYKESVSDIPTQIYDDIYSPVLLDYTEFLENQQRGQRNIALPVFGIVKGENAVAGYVCAGDDNGYIQLQPSGYGYLVNRLNAGITYRKTYRFLTPDGTEDFSIENERRTGDFAVRYFFLQGDAADYSGMAGAVRNYLKNSGRLEVSSLMKKEEVPSYIELFVSAREQTMLWENDVVVTNFDACQEILADLREQPTELVVSLLGWQKEGYGQYPAHGHVSGAAGGTGDLKSLYTFAQQNEISLLLSENFTHAYDGVGGFSKNKDAVQGVDTLPITDNKGEKYLLNAYMQLKHLTGSLLSTYEELAHGLAVEDIGSLIYDDYSKGLDMTRLESMAAYKQIAEAIQEHMGLVAVQNGNAYLLSQADFLFNVPDSSSNNPMLDESIPFYQLVVHGYIPYCSHIAGNMYYDVREQQLRWAEFGSVPYYLLTQEDPVALKDSYVNTVFSSQYDELKDEMKTAITEYSTKMGSLWKQEIKEHRSIDKTLKQVTYMDGSCVYINYGESSRQIDGISVEAEDYVVCLADGTQR